VRAVLLEEFGRINVEEADRPAVVRSDDVIVRVAAAGVCRTDLETIEGGLQAAYGAPVFPYVAGHETAGWVEEVGSEVEGLAAGDAVLLHPLVSCGRCEGCRAGRDMYCTDSRFPGVDAKNWGGFAEYVRTGERAVIKVPSEADLVSLSPYTDAGITAYHAIKRLLPYLLPGTTTVVLGVGGVGHFGLQLLKQMTSTTVIAVEAAESRARMAETLGADHTFQGGGTEHVGSVRDITNGGADVVIDFVGSEDSPAASLAMLRKGGVFSAVGAGGVMSIETLDLAMRELTIIGNLVGTYTELEELVKLHASGLRSEHVVFPLEDAAKALEDLKHGRLDGRAVLIPST
jgi:D-arabinose 1-dehydrogenase-like Zn-dependent alcohol dehydrogenase